MGQYKSKPKPDRGPVEKAEVDKNKAGGSVSDKQQNGGQEQAKTEESAMTVQQRNRLATANNKSKNKRTSFYETVDASEVLPYLIIGELLWHCSH